MKPEARPRGRPLSARSRSLSVLTEGGGGGAPVAVQTRRPTVLGLMRMSGQPREPRAQPQVPRGDQALSA